MFFQYPWNNFLHAQVEMCLVAAFNASVSLPTSASETVEQDSPFDAHPQNTENISTSEVDAPTKPNFLIEHVSYL